MEKTLSLPVTFIAQGRHKKQGRAIGRKGKALLVEYRIQDGTPRERWIPGRRIVELKGDIDSLPRYRSRSCPASQVEPWVPLEWRNVSAHSATLERVGGGDIHTACPSCGSTRHCYIGVAEIVDAGSGEILQRTRDGRLVDGAWQQTRWKQAFGRVGVTLGGRVVKRLYWLVGFKSLKLDDEIVFELEA